MRQTTRSNAIWVQNAGGNYYKNVSRAAVVRQEFRVVRDNRKVADDKKSQSRVHVSLSKEQVSDRDTSLKRASIHKHASPHHNVIGAAAESMKSVSQPASGQRLAEKKELFASDINLRQTEKSPDSSSVANLLNDSAVGVYSKSTDPVHVPSPDLKLSGKVGAIGREVRVVPILHQSTQVEVSFSPPNLVSIAPSVTVSGDSHASFPFDATKPSSLAQMPPSCRSTTIMTMSKLEMGKQQNRMHLNNSTSLKGLSSNMEWKPKSFQNGSSKDSMDLVEKLSQINVSRDASVATTELSGFPEVNCPVLVFGSFGVELDGNVLRDPSHVTRFTTFASVSAPSQRKSETATSTLTNQLVPNHDSPLGKDDSGSCSVQSLKTDRVVEYPQPEDMSPDTGVSDGCRNIEVVSSHGSCGASSMPFMGNGSTDLSTLPDYYSHVAYPSPIFRLGMDEKSHWSGLASSQEVFNLPAANISNGSVVQQQQQQPVPQLLPQAPVTHFQSFAPYRQIISPIYAPPVPIPNYSANTLYPHPSSGSNLVLMPGGGSHIPGSNLKYVSPQYKPVAAALNPTFANYNSMAYAMGAPGSMSGNCLEDFSRSKYKDGSVFVTNAQGEGSEFWLHTPREVPGLQAAPYYNLPGQAPLGAYLHSPHGPAPFNSPVQPAQVAFSGLYPSQHSNISNTQFVHQQAANLGAVMAGGSSNQVGPYLHPSLSHLSWPTNV